VRLPAIPNAWTMPIKARLDMLSTGIRTPVGLKINGADLGVIQQIAVDAESILQKVPGTRSAFAERTGEGYFLDFVLKREQLARYGLSVEQANMLVMTAIGGDNQSTVFDGRARYPVNVRYARDYRESPDALRRVLISTPAGAMIPLEEIADLKMASGPAMIRNENGQLNGYVLLDFDTAAIDVGTYVQHAKAAVDKELKLPAGYSVTWSGQYENMIRVKERLKLVLPITLVLIFGLIYANTRSAFKTSIVLLAVPFSAIGAFWLLWGLDYNMSIAVWVGLIALMGLDAETGIFMLLFLDISHDDAKRAGRLNTTTDLVEAIVHGAVKRIRPKAMTVLTTFIGLLPIMWSTGTGADLMKRIAAPMVGGLATSFILELLVYPAIYYLWKRKEVVEGPLTPEPAAPQPA
jgi:Cu(I)/Ag(I) efflux system membrane protein CusA/SilA